VIGELGERSGVARDQAEDRLVELGDRMGFDGMTVLPTSSMTPRKFMAVPKPDALVEDTDLEYGPSIPELLEGR